LSAAIYEYCVIVFTAIALSIMRHAASDKNIIAEQKQIWHALFATGLDVYFITHADDWQAGIIGGRTLVGRRTQCRLSS